MCETVRARLLYQLKSWEHMCEVDCMRDNGCEAKWLPETQNNENA